MTGPVRSLVFLAALACAASVWSCAKRGFPPGGPEDTTSPYVVRVAPPSGATGVPVGIELSIEFSERMKERTVETGVVVSPPCTWKKRYWDGNTYVLVPREDLRSQTTYLVSVSNKATDVHDVSMQATFVSGFSTGDSIDAGIVSGRVRWKNVDVSGAVVELLDAGAVRAGEGFEAVEPVYLTLAGAKGLYEIPFVSTSKSYRVVAFIDESLDSEYNSGEDVGCYPGEVRFRDQSHVDSVDVVICGKDPMGLISGSVDTSSVADTLKIYVRAISLGDSSVAYDTVPDAAGRFRIDCVGPGAYAVQAFADLNRNHKRDVEDTIFVEVPDTLVVESCAETPPIMIRFGDAD